MDIDGDLIDIVIIVIIIIIICTLFRYLNISAKDDLPQKLLTISSGQISRN